MAKIQLAQWPTNEWSRGENNLALEKIALEYVDIKQNDPNHLSTNYHLGLIQMDAYNFAEAERILTIAMDQNESHPGVLKNLGYAKLWQGKVDEANIILRDIPGIAGEIDAYVWWWDEQGKLELSDFAQKFKEVP